MELKLNKLEVADIVLLVVQSNFEDLRNLKIKLARGEAVVSLEAISFRLRLLAIEATTKHPELAAKLKARSDFLTLEENSTEPLSNPEFVRQLIKYPSRLRINEGTGLNPGFTDPSTQIFYPLLQIAHTFGIGIGSCFLNRSQKRILGQYLFGEKLIHWSELPLEDRLADPEFGQRLIGDIGNLKITQAQEKTDFRDPATGELFSLRTIITASGLASNSRPSKQQRLTFAVKIFGNEATENYLASLGK